MRLVSLVALFFVSSRAVAGEDFRATLRGDVTHSFADFSLGSATLSPAPGIPAGAEIVFASLYMESRSLWSSTGNRSECGVDRIQRGDFQNMTIQVGSGTPASILGLSFQQTDCGNFLTSSDGGNCDNPPVNSTLQSYVCDLRSVYDAQSPIQVFGAPPDMASATLFVVYCHVGEPVRDIVVLGDLLVLTTASGGGSFLFDDLLPNGAQARLIIAHRSAEQDEDVSFNGMPLPDLMPVGFGAWVDVMDVVSILSPGNTTGELRIGTGPIPSNGGCLDIHGVALAVTTNEAPGRAQYFGREVVGTGGLAPLLSFSGCPVSGGQVSLTVSQVLGGAHGCLVIGEGRASMPFRCGEVGVLTKLFANSHFVGGIPNMAGTGTMSWTFKIPLAVYGRSAIFQVGYLDPGACGGVSISKALEVVLGG